MVQIETMHALEQVEDIAKDDSVDGVFFGPADLAADMDIQGQILDVQLWEHIRNAAKQVEACRYIVDGFNQSIHTIE